MEHDATKETIETICNCIEVELGGTYVGNLDVIAAINALANLMLARAELIKVEFEINSYQENKFHCKET